MRVHHLSCGTMCPIGGGWLDGRSGSFFSKGRLVCHVLLIETPKDGLVLVDTGMGLEDCAHPRKRLGAVFATVSGARLDAQETAARQVEALGFSRADVRHLVLTHMDLDHAGGLSDFPEASVHLFRAEHQAATTRPTFAESERYRAAQMAHGPKWETYDANGEPWRGFPAVRDLRGLPPEILMIPLHGHSRGHAGVAVEGAQGWLLHAGDAYFHEDEMNAERPSCPNGLAFFQRTVAIDLPAMRANKERLRELVRDYGAEVSVFSAHDAEELARLAAGRPVR